MALLTSTRNIMTNQQKTPKISIVLPCYNGAPTLNLAIESCIKQDFVDWELIIVDDCSTDNTLEVANDYSKKDSRIKVFHNTTNKKLPASLNEGFRHASGEYLTWTSDDNILLPNMLTVLSQYLDNHNETQMVVGEYSIINEKGRVIKHNNVYNNINQQIFLNNYLGGCFMYRKTAANKIGIYNEKMFLVEDYDYWIRMALYGKIDVVHKPLYLYRVHSKSLTSTRKKEIKQKLLELRLLHYNDIEKKLHDYPQLLTLFYYRIVDALHGKKKWHHILLFTKKQPLRFGLQYFTRHQLHLLFKKR